MGWRKTCWKDGFAALLAVKRVSEYFSQVHCQRNGFRCSQNVLWVPLVPLPKGLRPQELASAIDSVVFTTEFSFTSSNGRFLP